MATTEATSFQPSIAVQSASIAANAATSSFVPLNGLSLLAVQVPATFTSSNISFTGSIDGGATYTPIHLNGSLYTMSVAANSINPVDPRITTGMERIKVVTGANENAARTLTLSIGPALNVFK